MNDLVVVQKLAGWEKLKALVLDSVSSQSQKGCTTWSWTSSCLAAGRRQLTTPAKQSVQAKRFCQLGQPTDRLIS
jgi:hypothetical protein